MISKLNLSYLINQFISHSHKYGRFICNIISITNSVLILNQSRRILYVHLCMPYAKAYFSVKFKFACNIGTFVSYFLEGLVIFAEYLSN
jgi:hypothetical protein